MSGRGATSSKAGDVPPPAEETDLSMEVVTMEEEICRRSGTGRSRREGNVEDMMEHGEVGE